MALMVELMSCHATLPDDAPLFSYRIGREVKVLKYGQALQAFRDIVRSPGVTQRTSRCTLCGLGGFNPCGWGGGFGKVNPESREVEVRFLQTVYSE